MFGWVPPGASEARGGRPSYDRTETSVEVSAGSTIREVGWFPACAPRGREKRTRRGRV